MKHLAILVSLAITARAVWPIPLHQSLGNSTLWILPDVPIYLPDSSQVGSLVYQGVSDEHSFDWNHGHEYYSKRDNESTSKIGSSTIAFAIRRTRRTIFEQSFVPWQFHPRHSKFEPTILERKYIRSITLTNNATDCIENFNPSAGSPNEAYNLTISEAGDVEIVGASSIGLAHGLTTFTQLFYKHSKGGVYTPFAPVTISDAPKFAHRGLNLDVSRNYFGVSDILRTIDALAYNKFNRLHLHVTDAQSWPLEIPSLPELAAKGAYRPDLIYSPRDIRLIQSHGARQGVEVYLEIDMPGHTSSVHYAYPELIASFNRQPDWDTYAAEPPSGTLKLNSSAVTKFTQTLFDDLLPRLAPFTSYFHTGGDEVNANAYYYDDTINSNDSAVIKPYMQQFVDRNHNHVRKHGLTPIVWEEMLLQWNLTLGKDVLVQTWQSDEAVAQTVAKGHKALAGNYNYWYLDCGRGQWLNFRPENSSQKAWPYLDYCSPVKNWRLIYSYDPLTSISPQDHHLVIGGEVHLWAEQTDPVNLDRMLWPRAAAAAEVLWSGAKDPATGLNRSQVEAAPRLSEMRERLVARGIAAEPIQMPFCLMGPNQCNL